MTDWNRMTLARFRRGLSTGEFAPLDWWEGLPQAYR